MNHLNELHVSCQVKNLHEIGSIIESNCSMYNQQLSKTIHIDDDMRTDDLRRYIEATTTLAVLNDSNVNKYFDNKELDELKDKLTNEAGVLRELLNLTYESNDDDGKKGETGYFTKFDRLYNVLMSE